MTTKAVKRMVYMQNYTNIEELPLILTPKDIGIILGISKNSAYAVVHSEGFPAVRVGKQYRVLRNNFFAWLDSQALGNAA